MIVVSEIVIYFLKNMVTVALKGCDNDTQKI